MTEFQDYYIQFSRLFRVFQDQGLPGLPKPDNDLPGTALTLPTSISSQPDTGINTIT